MTWFRHSRAGILFGVAVGFAILAAASFLVPSDAADSNAPRAAAAEEDFIGACPQVTGPESSVGDLNVRVGSECEGQKPLKLALWPVTGKEGPRGPEGPQGPPGTAANTEYGVASVFVSRGGEKPRRYATFSVALGSPVGSTTGGQFRFTCKAAQVPCKISWGGAVISQRSGTSTVFPRILVHKEVATSSNEPMTFCEYADGANDRSGAARVQRVPSLRDALPAMGEPQGLGVGSLDCDANQPESPIVREIWVPAPSDGLTSNYYDVWVTLNFR